MARARKSNKGGVSILSYLTARRDVTTLYLAEIWRRAIIPRSFVSGDDWHLLPDCKCPFGKDSYNKCAAVYSELYRLGAKKQAPFMESDQR